jgi:hypothetical protein
LGKGSARQEAMKPPLRLVPWMCFLTQSTEKDGSCTEGQAANRRQRLYREKEQNEYPDILNR